MRDKTKAIKALGLFIAFLVVVPVISALAQELVEICDL